MPARVLVLNGAPCSGKSTLARALQEELDDPWLYIDLDTFPARLPPFRSGRPTGDVIRRMFTGHNAAVVAIVEAGNDIVLELVARTNNPGASLVLSDLFDRLIGHEILVTCLRCTEETAIQRELSRAPNMQGLVQRDYGNVDETCCDLLLDTDTAGIDEQVSAVRQLLRTGSNGAIDRLRARLHTEAEEGRLPGSDLAN
jgi:chloramphenicol 3-O phosphotransferase